MEKPDVRELIRAEGFRFDKSLGQNFVFDGNLLGAIAADAGVCAVFGDERRGGGGVYPTARSAASAVCGRGAKNCAKCVTLSRGGRFIGVMPSGRT